MASTSSAKGLLTRKVTGLPLWSWGLILAGAVGIALYIKHKQAASAAATQPSATDTSGSSGTGTTTTGGIDPNELATLLAAMQSQGAGGGISGNPTVVDQVPPEVLDALVNQTNALTGGVIAQSQTLGEIAITAEEQMGSIASTALNGAFAVVQYAQQNPGSTSSSGGNPGSAGGNGGGGPFGKNPPTQPPSQPPKNPPAGSSSEPGPIHPQQKKGAGVKQTNQTVEKAGAQGGAIGGREVGG